MKPTRKQKSLPLARACLVFGVCLFALLSVGCLRSCYVYDRFYLSDQHASNLWNGRIVSGAGAVSLEVIHGPMQAPQQNSSRLQRSHFEWQSSRPVQFALPRLGWQRSTWRDPGGLQQSEEIEIPYVVLILVVGAVSGLLLRRVRYQIRQRRLSEVRCPKCEYDLRASIDRCPECGAPIPAQHHVGIGQ